MLDWSITCLAYVECQAVLAIVNQLMLQIISDYATNMTQFSEFLVEKIPQNIITWKYYIIFKPVLFWALNMQGHLTFNKNKNKNKNKKIWHKYGFCLSPP